jgi:hypothetical protein
MLRYFFLAGFDRQGVSMRILLIDKVELKHLLSMFWKIMWVWQTQNLTNSDPTLLFFCKNFNSKKFYKMSPWWHHERLAFSWPARSRPSFSNLLKKRVLWWIYTRDLSVLLRFLPVSLHCTRHLIRFFGHLYFTAYCHFFTNILIFHKNAEYNFRISCTVLRWALKKLKS